MSKLQRVRHGNGLQLYGKTQKGEVVRYEGQWELDKRHGRATAQFPDDSRYSGDFKNNVMHGHGQFFWPDGHKYSGEWVCGRMEGNGDFSYPSGVSITGKFVANHYIDVLLLRKP